jgi:rhodanese-related sulfurtransferase
LQENPAARKDFKIIDVRNADEFNSGHIKGATNFSYGMMKILLIIF